MNIDKQLMDLYVQDTEELRKQIEELRQEVDQWKQRALEAEASRARATRHIR